jgi:hypothetical protein
MSSENTSETLVPIHWRRNVTTYSVPGTGGVEYCDGAYAGIRDPSVAEK